MHVEERIERKELELHHTRNKTFIGQSQRAPQRKKELERRACKEAEYQIEAGTHLLNITHLHH